MSGPTLNLTPEEARVLYSFIGDFFLRAQTWREPHGVRYGDMFVGGDDVTTLATIGRKAHEFCEKQEVLW